MSKKQPDLSIITISANKKYLENCVSSIYQNSEGIDLEVIIIDMASKDNVGKYIKDKFPKVKVTRKEKRYGFGKNNNFGIKVAKGRYILFLNDDTKVITKDIFREMIDWMDSHPKVGVSSCALISSDKKSYQGSGGYFPALPRVFAWMTFLDDIPGLDKLIKPFHPMHPFSPFSKNESYYQKSHQQDWVTGAFFLTRSEILEEVGGFDEDFVMYVEELELCKRIKDKNWTVWYLPKWKIIHYGQVSTGSEFAVINEMKNLVLYYKKHHPKWQLPILKFILKLGCILRMPIFGKTYVKAFKEI